MFKKSMLIVLALLLLVPVFLTAGCSQKEDPGERLTLTLSYPTGNQKRMQNAEIIQDMLAEVGIEVILDIKEFGALIPQVYDEQDFDMYLMGWSLALEPDPSGIWLSTDAWNAVGLNHPDNDRLIYAGRATLDQDERTAIYQDWQKLLVSEAPYVWLYSEKEAWVANPRIENFRPDSFGLYWNVWDWKAAEGADQAVIAIWSEPEGLFNANLSESTYDVYSYDPVFVGMMRYDPDNGYELVSELAESMVISDDNLDITFKLRDDIYFHDGVKVTTEDVKFTFEWMCHPDYTGVRASMWEFIEGFAEFNGGEAEELSGVEVVDARTVIFHLSQVDAPSLTQIATWQISPKHVFEGTEIADLENHPAIIAPIGAGPYKFVRYEEGQFAEMEAYDKFHRGKPKLNKIIVKVATGDVAQAELVTGQTDIAWVQPNASDFALFNENGLDIHEMPANAYQYMGLKMDHPILSDVKVRQAITHALDRWAMVENLFDGMALVQICHMSSVSWAYDASLPAVPFDKEKANQLLDEAGWEMGADGYRYKK
jgi:ABC-type transport system substrate-binding protein